MSRMEEIQNAIVRSYATVSETMAHSVKNGSGGTALAIAVAGSLSLGLSLAQQRSFEALRPRRRFLLEDRARRFLEEYFETVSDEGSSSNGVHDDNSESGMMRFASTASALFDPSSNEDHSSERRSETYLRCELKELARMTCAAKAVRCHPDIIAGLEAAVVEQCRRRVTAESDQLALDARASCDALGAAAIARVSLPSSLQQQLQRLQTEQDRLGRSFLRQLFTSFTSQSKEQSSTFRDRWFSWLPFGGRTKLTADGEEDVMDGIMGRIAVVFALEFTTVMIDRVAGSVLDEPAVAFHLAQQSLPFLNDVTPDAQYFDSLRIVRELVRSFVPLSLRFFSAKVKVAVARQVHMSVFARLAATDQAVLDLCKERRPLVQFLHRGANNIRDAVTSAPKALAGAMAGVIVLGSAAYRRELPLYAIGLFGAFVDYDAIERLWKRMSGVTGEQEAVRHLGALDSHGIPPSTPRPGLELLIAAAAERQAESPCTPALFSFVSSVLYQSGLSSISDGVQPALRRAASAYATYCHKRAGRLRSKLFESFDRQRRRVVALATEADRAEFVASLLNVNAQSLALDPATSKTINDVLDDEERAWFLNTPHRIPLLPLSKWNEPTFLTLRQLGMEAIAAARAFSVQQEEQEAEAKKELASNLAEPSASVFVTVLDEWTLYASALGVQHALTVFPELANNLDSRLSGLSPRASDFKRIGVVTAEFLDGPMRFVQMYQRSIREARRGWSTFNDITHQASRLGTVTAGLRITIDDDPLTVPNGDTTQLVLSPETFTDSIEFRDVHFAYPSAPTRPVLRGLSFKLPKGATIGIVGPTGGGKSTVFKLLKRLYHPQLPGASATDIMQQKESDPAHTILIDGRRIDEFTASEFRARLGHVPQHPLLVPGTVSDNIAFGHPASEAEIIEAAKKARCHDFISAMPSGYQERISASRLSGGEKQRIAIARALVRRPEVLLLDEATSALDALNEQAIFEAMEDFCQDGRTLIIIAHRLSTLRGATHVVCIEGGVCVAEGTPSDLMSRHTTDHPSGKTLFRRYMDEQSLQQDALASVKEQTTVPPRAAADDDQQERFQFGSRKEALKAAREELEALRGMNLGAEVDDMIMALDTDLLSCSS